MFNIISKTRKARNWRNTKILVHAPGGVIKMTAFVKLITSRHVWVG